MLLLSNLYGDIVSDLCGVWWGGLGVVPAANIGESHAVFEAVHGSAPDISGQGIANPTALILSGVLMLRHLGEDAAADRVLQAVFRVLEEGEVRTPDLGGGSSNGAVCRCHCRCARKLMGLEAEKGRSERFPGRQPTNFEGPIYKEEAGAIPGLPQGLFLVARPGRSAYNIRLVGGRRSRPQGFCLAGFVRPSDSQSHGCGVERGLK